VRQDGAPGAWPDDATIMLALGCVHLYVALLASVLPLVVPATQEQVSWFPPLAIATSAAVAVAAPTHVVMQALLRAWVHAGLGPVAVPFLLAMVAEATAHPAHRTTTAGAVAALRMLEALWSAPASGPSPDVTACIPCLLAALVHPAPVRLTRARVSSRSFVGDLTLLLADT
jgi:hypothetical protein